MKDFAKISLSVLLCCSLVACGSGAQSDAKVETEETPTANEQVAESTESEPSMKDFDGSVYEEIGDGEFGLSYISGYTLEGQEIIIYSDGTITMLQLGTQTRDMNGSLLTFLYVDGELLAKEQYSDSQGNLDLTGSHLDIGEHTVEAVQFTDNDPHNEVTFYRRLSYSVVKK